MTKKEEDALVRCFKHLVVGPLIALFTWHYIFVKLLEFAHRPHAFPWWICAVLGVNTWLTRIGLIAAASAYIASFFIN